MENDFFSAKFKNKRLKREHGKIKKWRNIIFFKLIGLYDQH
ncbi:MAG: hypothetical protein ACI976_000824 [Aureispira sp.]|jgi:hypothetical protein